MLQHMPRQIGRRLSSVRPGPQKALHQLVVPDVAESITVSSPAFTDGGALPVRYTADGVGLSPPLEWADLPVTTGGLLLVIEDLDSPTPKPLVHAIAQVPDTGLPEGGLLSGAGRGGGYTMGLNSYFRRAYMSPDPPPAHGPHRYVFQVFALLNSLGPRLAGRRRVGVALTNNVAAKGVLTATYERP